MDRSLLQQLIIATTRRNWFRETSTPGGGVCAWLGGGNSHWGETIRGETSWGETSWGETFWGKRRLVEEMVWGETTRILDGKIVMCFTHYKINLMFCWKMGYILYQADIYDWVAFSSCSFMTRIGFRTLRRTSVPKSMSIYSPKPPLEPKAKPIHVLRVTNNYI